LVAVLGQLIGMIIGFGAVGGLLLLWYKLRQ
jgi:hypothetical protein